MNDKVKFERRSGIWNVRFPDGKNRSYKNQDLAEQAINTFLAQNPKYTAVMGDVKSSTKSSSKSKTVQKAAQNEPQSQMLDEVVVTAKHLHPEKLDQEGTVVTESKFASEDPFVQDAAIRSDLKQSTREGQNWIDRQQGRNYNQNFENAYYSMGNDWFLHPQDYIYPGYFNSDFHKNYREGSDLAGKIIAGYASSLWGLGKVFELPSTIGEIWQGAKGLYNAYKLNPLFGAYQTFKVAAPTAVGMAAGYGGYKGTDWVSRQLTGKTYGEKFSEATGLPIWFGDLTNPGGWLGGELGGYGTYKYGEGVTKRGIEMAMRTSGAGDPIGPIKEGLTLLKDNPKRLKDNMLYLFTGRKGSPGYNSFGGNYTGVVKFGLEDVQLEGGDIISRFLGQTDGVNPKIGTIVNDFDYGPSVSADLANNPHYGYPKIIQTGRSDKGVIPSQLFKFPKEGVGKTVGVKDQPIAANIDDPSNDLLLDVAGHNIQTRWNANGQPEFRRTDIWKFNPEDYEMKWVFKNTDGVKFPQGYQEKWEKLTNNFDPNIIRNLPQSTKQELLAPFRNANWKNRFLDFGLRVVDNISQPVVIRSTWQPFDLNSYTLPK